MAGSATESTVGRFAPSPTGGLHLGSLMTAVASYLDARSRGGRWLLRLEDLDIQRCVPGAADQIMDSLERHALLWDGAPISQRSRIDRYQDAIAQLTAAGRTFRCTCSRSQLGDGIYNGHCRDAEPAPGMASATRVRAPHCVYGFDDLVQGHFQQQLDRDVGDFIIVRRDSVVAYQLAVVIDDMDQRITHVVRGADLLDNTPRQLLLLDWLSGSAPQYAHVPVLTERTGRKLSKQSFARAIDERSPTENLSLVLSLLGHEPPPALQRDEPNGLINWAIANWSLARVPRGHAISGFVCI